MSQEYKEQHSISIGQRPWGHYKVLWDDTKHKVKEITVLPNQRLSLQRHQKRQEHWFICKGKALVTLDGAEYWLEAGHHIDIPRGGIHRIKNAGPDNLIFVEVQTGDYFGEDDIERLQDDYARA